MRHIVILNLQTILLNILVWGHRNFTADEHQIISKEVTKLLELGVIINSNHEHGECISPIFLVPKPDGSHRLIFNMKYCNQAVLYRHFKMDTLPSILSLDTPGVYGNYWQLLILDMRIILFLLLRNIENFLSFFGMAIYTSLLPYLWDFLVLREF